MTHFNEFVKEKRMERNISLRMFCRTAELDPSNWSKIERGLADAPKSLEILGRITSTLALSAQDADTLKDLAIIESIPKEIAPKEDILEKLPLFFRSARGEKLSEDELKSLIKVIEES